MNSSITQDEILLIQMWDLAELNYRKKICSKCNYKQRKIRNCTILKGGSETSCMKMQFALNKRKNIKELKNKILGNMMDSLEEQRKQIKENNNNQDLIN